MSRILLIYLGKKVIDSEVVHHYQHLPFRKTKSKRPLKDYYFQEILFPYNVTGSCILGTKEGSQIIKPYYIQQQHPKPPKRIETFQLYPIKKPTPPNRKGKIKVSDKVFVLSDDSGNYALTDPLTDKIILTTEIALLQIWDVYYPIMQEYFEKNSRYSIQYLTKAQIKLLTI